MVIYDLLVFRNLINQKYKQKWKIQGCHGQPHDARRDRQDKYPKASFIRVRVIQLDSRNDLLMCHSKKRKSDNRTHHSSIQALIEKLH